MNKERLFWVLSAIFFALFAGLMYCVMFVNVQPIGPMNSTIGLACVNGAVRDFVGTNIQAYKISEYLGYFALALVAAVGLQALIQLIKAKSFKGIKAQSLMFCVFFAVMAVLYVFFELFVVNYRPILVDNTLESAFPSSHTMLSVYVFIAFGFNIFCSLKKKALSIVTWIVCLLLCLVTVVARFFSGFHWLTDICAGFLLGLSLVMAYIASTFHSQKEN